MEKVFKINRCKESIMSEYIKINKNQHIMEIMMCKPPANAIDQKMSYQMHDAFKSLQEDDSLRVGILHAQENEKRIFCGGWDLKSFAEGDGKDESDGFDLGPTGIGGLPEFWGLYKPVVAAINGKTAGGGFEMLVGADIIIASEDSQFFLPEMQRGFLPDGGAIQQLHQRLPRNVFLDLILTGRIMSAQEAKHWGFVRDVVKKGDELNAARKVANIIADGAPLVSTALKEFLRFNINESAEKAHQQTRLAWKRQSSLAHYHAMLDSDDFNEGTQAFMEKRATNFKGK